MKFNLMAAIAAGLVSALAIMPAHAQSYPDRDITLIVPFNPGGTVDPPARAYAMELSRVLGVGVNIVNRAGGSGVIGATAALSAQPDGYTLGFVTANILAFQPIYNPDFVYRTTDDYEVIAKLSDAPSILLVKSEAPWETFEDLLQAERDDPGSIRTGVPGLLTAGDLSMQELNYVAGVEITTVPFSGGGGEALVALLGDRVESLIATAMATRGYVDAGELRVLAVFRDGPFEMFPDAQPTVQAGYDAKTPQSFYVVGPKGLPDAILQRLVEASAEVSTSEEYNTFLAENGYVADYKGPEEAIAEIHSDTEAYANLVANMGLLEQ